MRTESELDLFGAVVHSALTGLHAKAAATGRMSDGERGAVIALHSLSVIYNAPRGNTSDVVAHFFGIGVAAFTPEDRAVQAAMAGYDAWATGHHLRRLL